MITHRLTACARSSRPALFLLTLATVLWVAWLARPALAVAGPRPDPLFTGWRPGWLPSDPPAPVGGMPSFADPTFAGPTFAGPVWSLVSVQSPGLFVALDPVTGLPTSPSAAQRRAAAAQLESEDALRAPLSPLVVERLPGGGQIVHLGGRFQVYSVARRDAHGRFVTDCSLDPTAARRLLSTPVPPARRLPSPAAPAAAHREEK